MAPEVSSKGKVIVCTTSLERAGSPTLRLETLAGQCRRGRKHRKDIARDEPGNDDAGKDQQAELGQPAKS